MDFYKEEILDHYKNPRNFGDLAEASLKARETNASCGDLVEIGLKIKKKNSKTVVDEVKFKGVGCAISIAASSMLTEEVKGKTLEELQDIDLEYMRDLFGVSVSSMREKCLTLPMRALEKCISEKNVK